MNLLADVLSDVPTKDSNILALRQELPNTKIKFSTTPRMVNNSGSYYYNSMPIIPADRDIYKKAFNIGTVRVNWDKLEGTPDELMNQLKQQYYVSVQVCDKDYTKVKFVNQEIIMIIYDNEEKLKRDLEFYNKCFKTIDEQNKEKDSLRAAKMQQLKKLTSAKKYKK